eukprot:2555517-Prymnesium_polylepis.1
MQDAHRLASRVTIRKAPGKVWVTRKCCPVVWYRGRRRLLKQGFRRKRRVLQILNDLCSCPSSRQSVLKLLEQRYLVRSLTESVSDLCVPYGRVFHTTVLD